MKNVINELETLASDLRQETRRMVEEVRERVKENQAGFEGPVQIIHSYCLFVSMVPDELLRLAQELRNGYGNQKE